MTTQTSRRTTSNEVRALIARLREEDPDDPYAATMDRIVQPK